ncbi:MAG: hypothetical protein WDO06_06715 [Actinomycetota bacterium]
MLLKYPQVILWLAGHEHRHHVEWIGDAEGDVGLWQVETASHIDWPQQSRTVEVVRDDLGDIYIGLTVVDHAAPATYNEAKSPLEMAALARLLCAIFGKREKNLERHILLNGRKEEATSRNVVLRIPKREIK